MSGQTEAIPPPDIVFKGTDGNECEAFVVAIRDFAFATGRDGDHSWMLRFTTTRLRGKALRWHARLDSSVANDWSLFVQALFDQYPLAEEASEVEIATPVWSTSTFSPNASTAPLPMNPEADRSVRGPSFPIFPSAQAGREESHGSYVSNEPNSSTRQYDASSTGQQIGLLRLISVGVEGTSIPQYVWWGPSNYRGSDSSVTMTTINRHEALIVSFIPLPAPHTIGCLNSRGGLRTLTL